MTECNAIIEANNEIDELKRENKELNKLCVKYGFEVGRLEEENEQLKSTIAQLIEQNLKNNDLLLSDIRILEKALWCSGCENDYGRLKELRKEFRIKKRIYEVMWNEIRGTTNSNKGNG